MQHPEEISLKRDEQIAASARSDFAGDSPVPTPDAPPISSAELSAAASAPGTDQHTTPAHSRLGSTVLYPNVYVWFVFLGAMDIMLTWTILHPVFGGHEVNLIAQFIIEHGGLAGTLLFKFGIVVGIVVICEIVGRHNPSRGRWLAEWAVAITSIPVIVALIQIISRIGVWMRGG